MLSRIRQAFCLLTLAFAATTAAHAQLDPRLQGNSSSTDLLDVYKNGGGAKPELITVFDRSGSMHSMYWDPRYYADVNQSWHNNAWTDATNGTNTNVITNDFPGLIPVVTTSGFGSGFTVNIKFVKGTGYYQDVEDTTILLSGGQLVRPDGSLVTYASTGSSTSAETWIKQASHVRVTASRKVRTLTSTGYDGSVSTITRTVDLPLPWAVFEGTVDGTTAFETAADNGNAITVGMPKILKIHDPVPDPTTGLPTAKAQDYVVETLYQVTSQDNILNASYNGYQKIGRFHYNADYLWWIFFGQDVKVDSGGSLASGHAVPYHGSAAESTYGSHSGNYTIPDVTNDGKTAWSNGIPGMTRMQALKYAVIKTWVANQNQVWWAFRFLSPCGVAQQEEGLTTFSSNNTNGAYGDRKLLPLTQPSSASNPDVSMTTIQSEEPNGGTPLTYAVMNTYAQLASADTGVNGSVFNANKTENPIPACRQSFVVFFTDGIAADSKNTGSNCSTSNNGSALGTSDVYSTGAAAGNFALNGHTSNLQPGSSLFNIWTWSAVAAHFPTTYSVSGAPTDSSNSGPVTVPFAVTTRGATSSSPRRIRTMTVGMSLAGDLLDTTGGKGALYLTALYGNPNQSAWNAADRVPPYNPTDSNANDRNKNPFFFDATDPNTLVNALNTILSEVKVASSSLSAPSTPLVGLSLGRQVYLGTFTTAAGGPIWSGDLLMSGISVTSTAITFLDNDGNPTSTLNADSAVWSASDALQEKGWVSRNIKTALPSAPTTLISFDENNASITKAALGMSAATDQQFYGLIRFMRGADPAAQNDTAHPTTKTGSRSTMMGDIVNSSPAVVEFDMSKLPTGTLSTWLGSQTLTDTHFRVIFVGDNQGMFHAFGEVSGLDANKHVQGAVDELWAFIPTEFLPYLNYMTNSSNSHRYLVDGNPIVYFKDTPTASFPRGDGKVGDGDTLRVTLGLRKGGRGYYTFSFTNNDPTQPVLAWVVAPDNASSSTVVKYMGYSSSTPSIARVKDSSGNIIDAYVIGGGLSVPEVDSAFVPTLGANAKLGRSVLMVNVLDGTPLKSWDFVNDATLSAAWPSIGSVAAGGVSFEAIPNSHMAQRVYFTDQAGGIYALGNTATSTVDSTITRSDTSDYTTWGVRKVYQASSGSVISTTPAVFGLPSGVVPARTNAPTTAPSGVGIVVGTGDRNDPMDMDTTNPTGSSGAGFHRLVFVIDRDDSSSVSLGATSKNVDSTGFTDSDLANLTDVTASTGSGATGATSGLSVDPSSSVYYLKSKFGYYLGMDPGSSHAKTGSIKGGSNYFYEKIVSSPVVLKGVLFFSTFLPQDSSGSCGGSGTTTTYRMCSVTAPVFNSGSRTADTNFTSTNDATNTCSGSLYTFVNIGGQITGLGTYGVIQAGQVPTSASDGTGSDGTVQVQSGFGHPGTIGHRPRSWRVIR